MLFKPLLIAFLVGVVVSAIGVLLLVLRLRMRHQQLEAPPYRAVETVPVEPVASLPDCYRVMARMISSFS